MTHRSNGWMLAVLCTVVFMGLATSKSVAAHSASDAYLTLTADPGSAAGSGGAGASAPGGRVVLHGQWDIALRDLDFVMQLDDDGDGRLTWQEVERHQAAVADYAYRYLKFDGGRGNPCVIKPGRQLIDDHADGAYAALFFEAVCMRTPRKITLSYTLFFSIDPSHRGIFVMHSGGNVATALLSPQNTTIGLVL